MLKRDFSDIVYRALANYFDVQVINSNIRRRGKKLVFIDASSTTTVLAGQSESIIIRPPAGKVYKPVLMSLAVDPPDGATTDGHIFNVSKYGLLGRGTYGGLEGKSLYNFKLEFRGVYWRQANSYTIPTDPVLQAILLERMVFTSSDPLVITYTNSTDVDQTKGRAILLVVEELDELS